MRIGIDISQIVYEGTGVSAYMQKLVRALISLDHKNEYILFGSSFRLGYKYHEYFQTLDGASNVKLVVLPLPPTMLDILWNTLHIVPIEWFIGPVDVFWSSDWTQPPLTHARGITTIHDVSFLHYPSEAHKKTDIDWKTFQVVSNIPDVHRKRLARAKQECDIFLCDSEATKRDVQVRLGIDATRLAVVYPGFP